MFKKSKRIALKNYLIIVFTTWISKADTLLAAWPADAFEAESADQALQEVTADSQAEESNAISIKVPDIAENGAVVPVTVSTELPGVTEISILVENNPNPLTSLFKIEEQAMPFVSTRVKMAESSDITAIIKTENATYYAKRNIKVTIGGCGG